MASQTIGARNSVLRKAVTSCRQSCIVVVGTFADLVCARSVGRTLSVKDTSSSFGSAESDGQVGMVTRSMFTQKGCQVSVQLLNLVYHRRLGDFKATRKPDSFIPRRCGRGVHAAVLRRHSAWCRAHAGRSCEREWASSVALWLVAVGTFRNTWCAECGLLMAPELTGWNLGFIQAEVKL